MTSTTRPPTPRGIGARLSATPPKQTAASFYCRLSDAQLDALFVVARLLSIIFGYPFWWTESVAGQCDTERERRRS
jgi:hypothetical protein